ncbi:MAG: chemotaxis protein CheD [Candidatus Dadabacteria bacterium]|nr:MAG: chemotaxis protein CheD [Candidatus Dadabacteria bacterium]
MNNRGVNIAEMVVSSDPTDLLIASNLGSCIGVAIYDPVNRIGGLVHCLLPLSKADPDKAREKPCMYVDTGVVALLEAMLAKGANKKELLICVAGGAAINEASGVFQIGKKNVTVLRKILWKNNLLIKAHDLEKDFARTISLNVGTGEVLLRAKGETYQMLPGVNNGIQPAGY